MSAGEVVGLFGLMGSGRTELARILFGLDPFDSGELVIGGSPAAGMTPRRAIAARMAFLTENRREEGLMMNVPVADNIALASLARFGRTQLGIIDDARLAASAGDMAAALQHQVRTDRRARRSRACRAATSRRSSSPSG